MAIESMNQDICEKTYQSEFFTSVMLSDADVDVAAETGEGGAVTVHAICDGLIQKFVCTPI